MPEKTASKGKSRRWLIIAGALIAVCVCAVIVIAVLSPPARKATETPLTTGAKTAALEATEIPPTVAQIVTGVPAPTEGPIAIPTATLSQLEYLCRGISRELGSSNRQMLRISGCTLENGELAVRWTINDNLSEDLIRRGAMMDVENIIRFAHDLGLDYATIHVQGTYSMVDAYGNTNEDLVVDLIYNRDTVDKINWPNFLTDNIYTIADQVIFLHPEIQP